MKKIKLSPEEAEKRYANWLKMIIDVIKPQNLWLYGGRGTGKSTDIIAERSIDIIHDMPRACFAFVSDTYVNLMTNIVPAVLLGWQRKGFFEGYHYVVDKAPPDHWEQPHLKTFDYKHTISTFNGCKFFLTSLDRPSSNAGLSVTHHFGDESKYLKKAKLNKLFPTLRGDALLYGHSHYFMGQTFCSDLPNPSLGEDDWMLDMEENMDKEIIIKIVQASLIVNDIRLELIDAERKNAGDKTIDNINKKLERWEERLRKIRQSSSFFYIVSSFANADILTLDYFHKLLDTLDFEDFKTAVVSIVMKLEKGTRFYAALADKHFYSDGYNYKYYDQHGIKDDITQTSKGLKHIKHDHLLEAGFDAGNMMSLVVGQDYDNNIRILKNIYTLTPEWIRELADKFIEFFNPHKRKILHLYYDRSANQYSKAKRDFATKLKKSIESQPDANGKLKRTGWTVLLMSVGQSNITHEQEFDLMNEIMTGRNRNLPKLLIDAHECRELKSAMELAPLMRNDKGRIQKDKSSEKRLPLRRLPAESTNFTDAFKYLVCKRKYLRVIKAMKTNFGSVAVR